MVAVTIVLPAQEPPATFRAGVTLVNVDVQLSDRGGRPIDGLTAADFRVLDEGAPRPVLHFGHDAEPLDLALLLDVSGSMHKSLEEMAAAAVSAMRPLGKDDRVAVLLFARAAEVAEPLTSNFAAVAEEMRDAVRTEQLGSGTVINANIVFAAQYLARQPVRGRRAILIVTDNSSLNFQVSDETVLRELYAANAVLNALLVGKVRRPDPPKAGRVLNPDFTPSDVFKLARETGGDALEAKQAGRSLELMIARIRSRYHIAYEAPAATPGEFRHVKVELTSEARKHHADATIQARTGYYSK